MKTVDSKILTSPYYAKVNELSDENSSSRILSSLYSFQDTNIHSKFKTAIKYPLITQSIFINMNFNPIFFQTQLKKQEE